MMFCFFTGYAFAQDAAKTESAAPQGDPNFILADKLLGQTVMMYQHYIKGMFDFNIAMDAPSRDTLIDQVDRNQRAGKVLELNYFIEEALQDADQKTLATSIKWEKRVQPNGAREAVISKGKAKVIFKQQGSSDWRLYQVNGENPF